MKWLRQTWASNYLICELFLSLAVTIGIAIWFERFQGLAKIDPLLKGQRAVVYGTISTIDGALLGFVIATIAIILGLVPSESFALVRGSTHYRDLWDTYKATIRALAFGTVAALVALLVDRDDTPNSAAMLVCLGLSILIVARISRSVWILGKVVSLVTGT